jgi:leucyl/phenylalanyl-tRNA---protein transferase
MSWLSNNVTANPYSILYHFAAGYLPDFRNKQSGAVGWMRWSHRGLQFLDKFAIPRKQRPYVNSPKFELRFNHAFEETLRACADPARTGIRKRAGESWMTEPLIQGLLKLRDMGFAHSFETWQDNQLVGGIWGVQIGGLLTMSSMFNRVSNASKCAMARTMIHLKARGFTVVDMGMVPDHLCHFGAEWVPRWQYESLLPTLLSQPLSLDEKNPCRPLPRSIKAILPLTRALRAVRRKLTGRDAPPDPAVPQQTDQGHDAAHPASAHRPPHMITSPPAA